MKNKDKGKSSGGTQKPEPKKPFKPHDTRRRESSKPDKKKGGKKATGVGGGKRPTGNGAKKRPEVSTNKKDKKRLRI